MPETLNIETMFREYKNKIYRLALSITRNDKDAEDILQNTYLKIIKNLKNFRNESRLSTWIYKIAYNEALIALRKKYRQSKVESNLGLFVNWSKFPDEELLDKEVKERVDSAIRHIPIKYRMPLLLNNVEGLLVRDSAKILGLKINSIKTRLHRAHLMIRQEISDYFKDQKAKEDKEDKRCSLMLRFIYNYAGGNLDKRNQNTFDRHIEDCASCKSFLDTYVKSIRITRALECQDLPGELKAKLEEFLKKH